ncbi:hypothetical protein H6P81_014043 [Aristolochia fimbriata]|uniref:Uncharacterized protein n=1 Tax=Aristolochia fimbriata TaxID=158543 RepID=A0AAV7EGD7_ARIFI|nr:hypothetical protein H6P81_014043 [Aristolochia fimbriata]
MRVRFSSASGIIIRQRARTVSEPVPPERKMAKGQVRIVGSTRVVIGPTPVHVPSEFVVVQAAICSVHETARFSLSRPRRDVTAEQSALCTFSDPGSFYFSR